MKNCCLNKSLNFILSMLCLLAWNCPSVVMADDTPNVNNYPTLPLRGVNLSGAEFTETGSGWAISGKLAPVFDDAKLFIYRGMNTYRIPITWEYFADIKGNLLTTTDSRNYIKNVNAIILSLLQHNANVIIDLHNYMRYNLDDVSHNYNTDRDPGDIIGVGENAPTEQALATLWSNIVRMVRQYGYSYQNQIMFALMNEPHDIDMDTLVTEQNAAIAAIRQTESLFSDAPDYMPSHLIIIDGNYWSGLPSWVNNTPDHEGEPTNAQTYPDRLVDNANKIVYDVHQYFDANSSGNYADGDCLTPGDFTNGINSVAGFGSYWSDFKNWVTAKQTKFIIGEFGGPDTSSNNCKTDIQTLLNAVKNFSTSFSGGPGALGWTVWSAGHAWGSQYLMSIAPGGPGNGFMWNNRLYQNYLTAVGSLPPLGPQIALIKNNSATTLNFGGGYWPFQLQGSSALAAGATAYLYSPVANNVAPGSQVEIDYLYKNTNNNQYQMGVGVDPASDPTGIGYGYSWAENTACTLLAKQSACSVTNITNGDTANRCWSVSINAAGCEEAGKLQKPGLLQSHSK